MGLRGRLVAAGLRNSAYAAISDASDRPTGLLVTGLPGAVAYSERNGDAAFDSEQAPQRLRLAGRGWREAPGLPLSLRYLLAKPKGSGYR